MNRERRVEIMRQARRIAGEARELRVTRQIEARDFERRPAHAKATKAAEFAATMEAFNQAVEKLNEVAVLLRVVATDQAAAPQQLAVGMAGIETHGNALAELAKR